MTELYITDEAGKGLEALVECYFIDGTYKMVPTLNSEGLVRVPTGEFGGIKKVTVLPVDGHWQVSRSRSDLESHGSIVCPQYGGLLVEHWWRNLICADSLQVLTGEKISVGIIDAGFSADDAAHIGKVVRTDIASGYNAFGNTFHGLHVAKIVAAILDGKSDFEIIAWDAPSPDGLRIDFDAVCIGIARLVEDHKVDIINLSCGFRLNYSLEGAYEAEERLNAEIKNAVDNGVIVVAASGNDGLGTLPLPAAIEDVVAVGAIGMCGIAPKGTDYVLDQIEAEAERSNIGKSIDGRELFLTRDSSFGPELNLVAPGLGVIVKYADGSKYELKGTSFSAPMVTAFLAHLHAMHGKTVPATMEGLTKMLKMCTENIGLPNAKQGLGMLRAR